MTETNPPSDPLLARGERARLVELLQQAHTAADPDPGALADAILGARWRLCPDDPVAALASFAPDARGYITLVAEHGSCICDDTLPCDAAESACQNLCSLCVHLDPDARCPAHHPQRYPASPHPAVLLEALRAEHAAFLADLHDALETPARSPQLSG